MGGVGLDAVEEGGDVHPTPHQLYVAANAKHVTLHNKQVDCILIYGAMCSSLSLP